MHHVTPPRITLHYLTNARDLALQHNSAPSLATSTSINKCAGGERLPATRPAIALARRRQPDLDPGAAAQARAKHPA